MNPKNPFRDVLEKASNFAFNPSLEQDEEFKGLEPVVSPLTFYDRHINSQLVCKNLKDFSALGPTLSKAFDDAITDFYNKGYKFSAATCGADYINDTTSLEDARSLNLLYGQQPGGYAHHFPSKFYFHPEGFVWDSVFRLSKETLTDEMKFTSECSLRVFYRHEDGNEIFDDLRPSITDAMAKKLEDIRDRYPPLANWLFFPMTPAGKSILKRMQGSQSLRWETSKAVGYKNISSVGPPLDADDGVLYRARILSRGRKKRVKTKSKEDVPKQNPIEILRPLTQRKSAYVTVWGNPVKSVRHYLDSHHYIQHAWATAARQDSTFMVFNCGMYERIGVRHRKSQILYISPLFETINSRNPPYGKLHLGLHTAIVQDFLERYERDNQKSGEKRSADHFDDEGLPQAKRAKLPFSALSDDAIRHLSNEINDRDLALITLNYGPYCSPVHASFFRVGSSCAHGLSQPFEHSDKSKYSRTEYFKLMLGEPLGEGAVGVVHPASLTLSLDSGKTLRHDIVIMLAFSDEQKTKLEHEFRIYTVLADAKEPVEGIVTVHGLFADPQSGSLALFMENGGQSLRELNDERPERDGQLRNEEREACIRALKSVHKTRTRHRDLRPDNILISRNPVLMVSIIDFDSAEYPAGPEQLEHEIERVEAIFDGQDFDSFSS